MKLGTKAESLYILEQNLRGAKVLPQYMFTVGQWRKDKPGILEKFEELPWKEKVIVRSSSLQEDTGEQSLAGKYESVADVSGKDRFAYAVDKVIESYDDGNEFNQVLVQPMLEDVDICGVAFTLEPGTGGHYYVVSYDKSGSTSAITSGGSSDSCLYYRFKECTDEREVNRNPQMEMLCRTLHELEHIFGMDNLDVEFAYTKDGGLYILQVRPLCVEAGRVDGRRQKEELRRIAEKVALNSRKNPFLCGDRAVYSVMTDWNPAEMIGVRPKPLAMSLYREIITDSVWAYQRDNYGYRNLRSFPLMVDFAGLPYIDVRVSFNSFIPSGLDEPLSEKLVNYYLEELVKYPEKHDKAEFEIVYSCYTLDLQQRVQVLKGHGFSEDEIAKIVGALRNVTNHIIDYRNGLWRKDYKKIEYLNRRYSEVMESGMSDIEKTYWLLEDCKRYGTLPFAGLARAAFIAVQMLRSFVSCGILGEEDYEAFMGGIETVSSGMNRDCKELSKSSFLRKYGHLRPGTYDITSLRYDEAPELYFDEFSETMPGCPDIKENGDADFGVEGRKSREFRLSLGQLNRLRDMLQENGLSNDVLDIMEFMRCVIEGREYGKFVFTRNLSMAMHLIGQMGAGAGISREECAYMNIRAVYDLYVSTGELKDKFLESVRRGKESYEMTQVITLPPVIALPVDVYSFYYPDSEPNFITSRKICGEVGILEAMEDMTDIEGKIVMIQSADPGYDWIFSHGIGGFVTMYGGANSHMAIRAGELGIPAAIGVGAKRFERYRFAKIMEIDALSKTIKILK